jgi:hypothetical protein
MDHSTSRRLHDEGIAVVCSTVEGPANEDELMDADATRRRLERVAERIAGLVEVGRRLG